ncbi:MAG TPA: hypothetical protein VK171_04460, partial [Fimbriimonas sp.]|nr:hypothetical protein [Fimbriimonas sp.]
PTGRRTGNVKPVADRVLARWQSRLRRIGNLIREEFEDHLPLNLHSVEDKFGNWQFLNLRRTASLPMFGQIPHNLWIVRSRTDVVNWNGTDPVLVQAAVNRGREYELVELAKDLPSTVYIDFGWLSHPAMVLREAGINVIPVY